MTKTITGNIASGYLLNNPAYTPFYVASGASITNGAGTALFNGLSANWTIDNAGLLAATGTTGIGLAAAAGGALTNASGAQIGGYDFGVSIGGTGSVLNQGKIAAAETAGFAYSYYSASKSLKALSAALYLAGGTVDNTPSATIAGTLGGVALGGQGTVTNAGTIEATSPTRSAGILLSAGGAVTNATNGTITGGAFAIIDAGTLTVSNAANAVVSGASSGILAIDGAGSVTNTGRIIGGAGNGIQLVAGGTVANLTSGAIAGYISGAYDGILVTGSPGGVTNQGTIRAQTLFTTQTFVFGGVILAAGGSVTNSGTILSGSNGVRVDGAAGTVVNSGLINSQRTVSGGAGINLRAGGAATNSGVIVSGDYGVYVSGGTGSATNTGLIASYRVGAGAGVDLLSGGTLTNSPGGLIASGFIGVQMGRLKTVSGGAYQGSFGTLNFVNQGTVIAADGHGDGAAVWMYGPGTITNAASGVIAGAVNGTIAGYNAWNGLANGGWGIVAYYQTTLVNYGSIGGAKYAFEANNKNPGTAISNLIKVAPGASFGAVVKGATGPGLSTLELMSGASAGTISNFGTTAVSGIYHRGYIDFATVKLDDGARWNLGGTVSAGTTVAFAASNTSGALTLANPSLMQGTITGFRAGDTLSLGGITTTTGVSLSSSGNLLTVQGTGLVLQFDPAQSFAGMTFAKQVVGAQTDITVSCFAAGTSIHTPDGPVRVEGLSPGARVLTHRGESAEIIWIGHRAVDCGHHPAPETVYPVRIRAGVFGRGVPSRDLWLSPDHAVFVEGVLIPVRCLINGGTVRQETVPAVTYYHIELPEHDVILAEGLPVESYLDTGDRANFVNGGAPVRLFPDFSARTWEMAGCAPLVMSGLAVERLKRRLAPRVNNRYTYY